MNNDLFESIVAVSKQSAALALADRLTEYIDRIDREHDGMREHPYVVSLARTYLAVRGKAQVE